MKIKSMWLWAPLVLVWVAGARAQEKSALPPDAYHAALRRELADKWKMPSGTPLLPQEESANVQAFEVFGPAASNATESIIAVEGQAFKTAIRIDIAKPGALWWHVMGRVSNRGAIRAGDSVLASFWVRGQVPSMGGSEAELDAGLKDIPDPQQEYTTLHLSANPNWQRVFLPMTASKDRATGEIQFIFVLGYKKQQIDLAGFSLIDFGPDVRVEQLPRPTPQRFTYPNRAPDAPWRKAALKRIDRIRKGNLTIRVVDAKGRAIPDAQVRVAMTRHAFRWGTSLVPSYDLFPPASQDALRLKALPVMYRTFNHAAIDIDLKIASWLQADEKGKQKIIDGLKILKSHGMTIHAHVLFWPNFNYNEPLRRWKDDPSKLHAALTDFIRDVVSRTAPYVDEWDVVNEPYDNREMTGILGGPKIMAEWFKLAHRMNPRARLYLNDYGLAESGGSNTGEANDTRHRAYNFNLIRDLRAMGAPVGGIGMQSHFNRPNDPQKILEHFDQFAPLGLPIAITEFDAKFGEFVNAQDEADFVRDFTIAAFSHPAVDSFTMWGFSDAMHWLRHAPLYDKEMNLKPSGKGWRDLVFKRWWTNTTGRTNTKGVYALRAFLGDYQIAVTRNGKTRTVQTSLSKAGRALEVVL